MSLVSPYWWGIFFGVDFNVDSVNPDKNQNTAIYSHFFVGLTAQVALRITYCYESP